MPDSTIIARQSHAYANHPVIVRIREARVDAGISQRELGRRTEIAQQNICRIEGGALDPDKMQHRTLQKIADSLNTTVAALRGEAATDAPDAGWSTPDPAVKLFAFDQLAASPRNPRGRIAANDPSIDELAASIAGSGLLEPLVVRDISPGPDRLRFEIIAGHRRYEAIGRLREDGRWAEDRPVPATLVEADDATALALAITENLQRDDIHPLAEAAAFRSLRDDHGWDTARIAASIGKSRRHVQIRIGLADHLAEEVRDAFADGEINLAAARALAAIPAGEQAEGLRLYRAGEVDRADRLKQLMHPTEADRRAERQAAGLPEPAGPIGTLSTEACPDDPHHDDDDEDGDGPAAPPEDPHPDGVDRFRKSAGLRVLSMFYGGDGNLLPQSITLYDEHTRTVATFTRAGAPTPWQPRDVTPEAPE